MPKGVRRFPRAAASALAAAAAAGLFASARADVRPPGPPPFERYVHHEHASASRDGYSVWLPYWPGGGAPEHGAAHLIFECRAEPGTEGAPSSPLAAVLIVPRAAEEPDARLADEPAHWALAMTGRAYRDVPAAVRIRPAREGADGSAPQALALRMKIRRISYSVPRPDHWVEGLPARALLAELAAGRGIALDVEIGPDAAAGGAAGDVRHLALRFPPAAEKTPIARQMIGRCPL